MLQTHVSARRSFAAGGSCMCGRLPSEMSSLCSQIADRPRLGVTGPADDDE